MNAHACPHRKDAGLMMVGPVAFGIPPRKKSFKVPQIAVLEGREGLRLDKLHLEGPEGWQ